MTRNDTVTVFSSSKVVGGYSKCISYVRIQHIQVHTNTHKFKIHVQYYKYETQKYDM